ncbi:hypothetical protein [Deinococcus hohokamensis]|uniref:DUF3606 domain-containing protein n=1 Tax=Deinococcus hohokamensis TaxID=309883 RepID=A0ABV9IAG7_9DEIO
MTDEERNAPQRPKESHEVGAGLDLEDQELAEIEERSAISPTVVHEAIRKEGEEELTRSTSALG